MMQQENREHFADDGRRRRRVLILGGGFGGLWTARHLERLLGGGEDIEIVLISLDNYFLMTPLLFEACSGTLEVSHCSMPAREFLRSARFVEAMVTEIDLERRVVTGEIIEGRPETFHYDQLVLALGSMTNHKLIPGSEAAFTFKTLADAILLRNHLIERFERADAERDPQRKRGMLNFVIVGGGLVGIELLGELSAFVEEIASYYPHVRREEVKLYLFQHSERILPEIEPSLAEYAHRVLESRPGVDIRTRTPVKSIARGRVELASESIETQTVVLCAGVVPHPLVAALPVKKDERGRVVVEATLRCPERPELWALGDCANIPTPDGGSYPTLAQHALREAQRLAENIHAAILGLPLRPFNYHSLGSMAALGNYDGIGRILGIPVRGFLAWWLRRTYYLLQMPRWSRRMRIVVDWTMALLLRPDIVKLDLQREAGVFLEKCGGVHPGAPPRPAAAVNLRPMQPAAPSGMEGGKLSTQGIRSSGEP